MQCSWGCQYASGKYAGLWVWEIVGWTMVHWLAATTQHINMLENLSSTTPKIPVRFRFHSQRLGLHHTRTHGRKTPILSTAMASGQRWRGGSCARVSLSIYFLRVRAYAWWCVFSHMYIFCVSPWSYVCLYMHVCMRVPVVTSWWNINFLWLYVLFWFLCSLSRVPNFIQFLKHVRRYKNFPT